MFNHKYRYFFVAGLAIYTYINTVFCEVYRYFNINIEWYYALLTIIMVTLGIWEGNRLVEKTIRKRISPKKERLKFLAVFFITGTIISLIVVSATVYIIGIVIHQNSFEANKEPFKLNLIYAGLANLLFHLINAILFFFNEYKQTLQETEELKRISAQSQLQLIRSQVNPHFLFNNLNVLAGMVVKENPDANKFIEEFAKVYRYILTNQDKELVSLQSEVDFIQPYIFLLKKRFSEGLKIHIDIPQNCLKLYVVPVALQMLVENAIKHNVVSQKKPLNINMYTNADDLLIISNNLQLKTSVGSSTQIGLENIMSRYQIISGKTIMINRSEDYFEVGIPLLNLN